MSVLMGANIADDIARGDSSEAIIGSSSEEQGKLLKSLFSRRSFTVTRMEDIATVESIGALTVR